MPVSAVTVRGVDDPEPDLDDLMQETSTATAAAPRPLDLRTFAVTGLFVLAAVYTLHAARELLVPIVVAALFKIMLEPVVRVFGRVRIKPPLAAAIVMIFLLAALAAGVVVLIDPAAEWLDRLPVALRRIEATIAKFRGPVDQMTAAADRVEKIAGMDESGGGAAAPEQSLPQMLFSGVWNLAGAALVMLVLLYFLLASGDLFLRKLVKVLPRLDDKRRAVEVARQIENEVSRHLLAMTAINFALGGVTAVALYFAGMPNPVLWGLVGALLNYIPYVGPLIGSAIVGAAAFITFDQPSQVLLVVAIFFAITSLEGNLLTPLLLGRRLALNPVAVFIALSFWSFLWGTIGALLAMPLLIVLKALCDRIPRLTTLGEFLSPARGARELGDH